jgi:hypothetical protein
MVKLFTPADKWNADDTDVPTQVNTNKIIRENLFDLRNLCSIKDADQLGWKNGTRMTQMIRIDTNFYF